MATNADNLEVLRYLVNQQCCDVSKKDRNGEDCLSLAIKNKRRTVANWLISTNLFKLDAVMDKGFNYFAYAVVKGQHILANQML